jgi:hypothetical protein
MAGVLYALAGGWALVFGAFPTDLLVNLVHLGLGAWGIIAYASRPAARSYARRLAIATAVLVIIALLAPSVRPVIGLEASFEDFWLHVLTVAAGLYFGWGRRRQTAAYERSLRRAA